MTTADVKTLLESINFQRFLTPEASIVNIDDVHENNAVPVISISAFDLETGQEVTWWSLADYQRYVSQHPTILQLPEGA